MLFFAEQATESETVRKRISREHLSIEYLRAVRIADSHERCSATDKFAKATHGKGFGGSPETDRPKLRENTKTSGILSKGKKTGLKGKNILFSTPLPFAIIKAEINMICAR